MWSLALLFCNLNNSLANGGVSTVNGNNSLGNTNWNIGSRISFVMCSNFLCGISLASAEMNNSTVVSKLC